MTTATKNAVSECVQGFLKLDMHSWIAGGNDNKIHLHVDSNSICMISIIQNILLYCSDTGLILSYDAGWQKRGSGRNYNSLSGILYFELLID